MSSSTNMITLWDPSNQGYYILFVIHKLGEFAKSPTTVRPKRSVAMEACAHTFRARGGAQRRACAPAVVELPCSIVCSALLCSALLCSVKTHNPSSIHPSMHPFIHPFIQPTTRPPRTAVAAFFYVIVARVAIRLGEPIFYSPKPWMRLYKRQPNLFVV